MKKRNQYRRVNSIKMRLASTNRIPDSAFSGYYSLRDEIDAKTDAISSFYREDMACSAGCSGCCMPISLLPLEFYAIRRELEKAGGLRKALSDQDNENQSRCVFLKNSLCLIYSSRPVICRTQGLPLLYYSDESAPDYA